jgi:hypothetical protein
MSTDNPTQYADLVANDVLAECEQTDEGWVHSCGSVLLAARVHHTVHDSPIPLAGSGRVEVQTVPYCPTCHEKPSDFGAPITLPKAEWPVVKIRRKAEHSDGSIASQPGRTEEA